MPTLSQDSAKGMQRLADDIRTSSKSPSSSLSGLIESAARDAVNMIPGVAAAQATVDKQNVRGGELLKQLALGGAALGGGTGAAVALINYLKSMREEEEAEDASRINDDTLYVPMPATKQAGVNRWLAPGLAVTSGILAAGGAYALTQKIYNYMQRKQREKMLDEAQNEALTAADIEVSKSAANLTFADLVTAFPVAVPLLAALASGGVAYAALNKTFPTVEAPKSRFPKRIRAVLPGGDVAPLEEGLVEKDTTKEASVTDADCEAAASEFLMLFVDSVGHASKQATLTSELLGRVSTDGTGELRRLCMEQGLPAACEVIKGASCKSDIEKVAAAAVISRDAVLGPVASTLAASEFIELLPGVASICSATDPEYLDKLAGVGVLLHEAVIRPDLLSKEGAAISPELLSQLLASLRSQQQAAPGAQLGESADAALTSDTGGSMAEDTEGDPDLREDAKSIESQGKKDAIDAFIEDPNRPGIL